MKVFYYCQTGKYAALFAAALHIKALPKDLSFSNFLLYINTISLKPYEPFYVGEDEMGMEVYAIGTGQEENLVAIIIKSFLQTFTTEEKNTVIINSLPNPNFFLSCILKLSTIMIIKYLFQGLLPYAVWHNRKYIQKHLFQPTLT